MADGSVIPLSAGQPGFSGKGGALDFTARLLGGLVQEQESNVLLSVTASQIVGVNADRVGLIFINLSTVSMFVSLSSLPTSSSGILLTPSGGSLSINVLTDFTLTARSWAGITSSATGFIYVLEIIRILQPSQVKYG